MGRAGAEFTLVQIISLGPDRISKEQAESPPLTLSWGCLTIPAPIYSDTHLLLGAEAAAVMQISADALIFRFLPAII